MKKAAATPSHAGELERRNAELAARNLELERIVEQLRGRERLYRTVADFAFDWEFMINPTGRLVYVSPSCERVTGYPPEAFLDDPGLIMRIVHPDDLPSLNKHVHGEIDEKALPPLDFRILTASGETRWISHACRAVFDESGVFVGRRAGNRDITGRMAMEEALRLEKHRYQAMFEGISSCVAVFDPLDGGEDFIFKEFNRAGLESTRLRREEVIGESLRKLFPGVVEMGLLDAFRRVLATGEPERTPLASYRDDRIELWLENFVYRLPSGEIVVVYEDLSEKKKAEEALRAKEQLLHKQTMEHAEELEKTVAERTAELRKYFNAVEHSKASILMTDPDGNIEYVNPFFTELTGYARAEVVGGNPKILKSGLHDSEFYKEMWGVLTAGLTWRGEICNRKKDGSFYWEDATISPVLDDQDEIVSYVAVKADITRRKRNDEALRESETRYKTIFQGSPEGILVADNETLKFLHANKAMCGMLGYREEELLGLGVEDIHPLEDLPLVLEEFARLARREISLTQTLPCLRKDGSVFYADISVSVMTIDGRDCSMGFFRDVTERRTAARLKEDIDLILRHDLKAPLSGVITLPEIMLEEPGLCADMRENLGIIRDAGRRMLDMINNSLDLYRMETGAYVHQPRPMDLRRTIAGLRSDLAPLAAEKGADIRIVRNGQDCALPPPLMIMGEELLIYSMLSNLLLNAVEATPEGGSATLEAKTSKDGKTLSIAIHNEKAVPLIIRDRFFEKYATHGKIKGTGLGAYSARLMARTMGGDVTLETSEESGTTVTATIPLIKAD